MQISSIQHKDTTVGTLLVLLKRTKEVLIELFIFAYPPGVCLEYHPMNVSLG